jgi:hypothetical protein
LTGKSFARETFRILRIIGMLRNDLQSGGIYAPERRFYGECRWSTIFGNV